MYIEINKHIMRNKIRESRHSAHMDVLIFYGIVPKTTKSFIYGKSCIGNTFCKSSATTDVVYIHHNGKYDALELEKHLKTK